MKKIKYLLPLFIALLILGCNKEELTNDDIGYIKQDNEKFELLSEQQEIYVSMYNGMLHFKNETDIVNAIGRLLKNQSADFLPDEFMSFKKSSDNFFLKYSDEDITSEILRERKHLFFVHESENGKIYDNKIDVPILGLLLDENGNVRVGDYIDHYEWDTKYSIHFSKFQNELDRNQWETIEKYKNINSSEKRFTYDECESEYPTEPFAIRGILYDATAYGYWIFYAQTNHYWTTWLGWFSNKAEWIYVWNELTIKFTENTGGSINTWTSSYIGWEEAENESEVYVGRGFYLPTYAARGITLELYAWEGTHESSEDGESATCYTSY